ncbi:MAG: dockerin type I repeat-containing protein [Clostridia bacterium]|nr:dockerin type I repeat-containing protein [Clostridia bacterium]
MRKMAFVLVFAVLFACLVLPTGASAADVMDIDGDGDVSAQDARLVLRAAIGLEELPDGLETAADADSDGELTTADARVILRAAIGLPDTADWKAAYRRGLYDLREEFSWDDWDDFAGRKMWFSLAYIDGDDIPELMVAQGVDHPSKVEIYTYAEGEAVLAGTAGSWGVCLYEPGTGYVGSVFSGFGVSHYVVSRLENGTLTQVWSAINNEGDGLHELIFKVNDVDVGRDEYMREYESNWELHDFIPTADVEDPQAYRLAPEDIESF